MDHISEQDFLALCEKHLRVEVRIARDEVCVKLCFRMNNGMRETLDEDSDSLPSE